MFVDPISLVCSVLVIFALIIIIFSKSKNLSTLTSFPFELLLSMDDPLYKKLNIVTPHGVEAYLEKDQITIK